MPPPAPRPTTEVADVLLDSMDRMFGQLIRRLDGLTAEEYLWEPVEGAWSVRPSDESAAAVDGAGIREIDPPPVTTIAWRLWHIAIDCFDDYTRRFSGDMNDAPATWTLDPDEAVEMLEAKWLAYRATISSRNFWTELGENWEHWAQSCVADMAMHASNELVHHAAEVALLRDLYAARAAH